MTPKLRKTKPGAVVLGLIQSRCSPDPAENFALTARRIAQAARQGAQIICTQELFRSHISARRKIINISNWPSRFPGPSSKALQQLARRHKTVLIASLFEKRARRRLSTTPPSSSMPTASCSASTARCTSRTTRSITKNSTLHRATWAFAPGRRVAGKSACCICWDQWYPEAARLTALQGAGILFYPTAIGWHPSEKSRTRSSTNIPPGKPSSAATPWPTAATSPPSTASAWKSRTAGRDWNSGAKVLWPVRPGRSWPKPARIEEEILLAAVDLGEVDVARTHWPFLRDRRIDAYGALTQRWID